MAMFEFFFEIMERVPRTIITDDQRALGFAIERLRKQKSYEYVHMLDWYHKIDNIKKITKKEPFRDELFGLLCRSLKEPSRYVYFDIISEAASLLNREESIR